MNAEVFHHTHTCLYLTKLLAKQLTELRIVVRLLEQTVGSAVNKLV